MLRVVGGKYKRRKLEQPPLSITRSTKDIVKEAVFNSLGDDIFNSSFLDLFGGSGAIGIEAYSRGAKNVSIVDISKDAMNVIKKNLHTLGINDINLYLMDYKKSIEYFKNNNITFDFVYVDPPYAFKLGFEFIEYLENSFILNNNFKIIIESDFLLDIKDNKYEIRNYKYGKTYISIIKKNANN